jgi:hypothetical protein
MAEVAVTTLIEAPHANGSTNRVAGLVDDAAGVSVPERVKEEMKHGRITQAAVAGEVGVSTSTLSMYLNDKYHGDVQEIEAKVLRWLAARGERVQVRAVVPEPPRFFASTTATEITNALRYAQGLEDMIAVAGVPGIGKSTTCDEYRRGQPNVWVAEAAAHTTGLVPILKLICDAVGVPPLRGAVGASGLAREIAARVAKKRGLLIIDEAHHIDLKALDAIRALHDSTGVAIALVGGPPLLAKLESMPQLWSRIGIRLVRTRVQPGDVDAQLDAWGIARADERKYLTSLAQGPGALRRVNKTLRLAGMLARDSAGVTLRHIQDAASSLSAHASDA